MGGGVAWVAVVLIEPGILSLFFSARHTTMLVMMVVTTEDTRPTLTLTDRSTACTGTIKTQHFLNKCVCSYTSLEI